MARSPVGFLSLSYLPSIFQCSIRCLETTSANALISVYLWYTDLATLLLKKTLDPTHLSMIESLFTDPSAGGVLVQSSLKGLLTTFPKERDVIDYVGTFFMEFYNICPNYFFEIINSIVEGFSDDQISRAGKDSFKAKVSRYISIIKKSAITSKSRERLCVVLSDFSAIFSRRNFQLSRLKIH